MKNTRLRILNYIVAVVNLALSAVMYPSLPDQIPMNWGFDGTVSYSSKSQLFLMCGMAVFFAFLFDVLPHIDPRKKNYQKFGSYYDSFCIIMQFFLLAMTGMILTESLRPGTVSVPTVVNVGVGLLLLFLGNIMPKIKSNFYMGIKNPWTLSSDEIWYRTHRLGGKCFFLAGMIMMGSAFFPSQKAVYWITFICVMLACIIPSIMSYIWWRQEQKMN
ncbi:MAG: SdpI family protein [Clostridiales bacterium]|nr:SdpI family protein [Clostridiales bacterium]